MSSGWFEGEDSDILPFGSKPVGGVGDVVPSGNAGGIQIDGYTLAGRLGAGGTTGGTGDYTDDSCMLFGGGQVGGGVEFLL